MNFEIEIRDIEPVTAAVIHYKGKVDEAGKHFRTIFQAIKGKSCGAPFFCYHSFDQNTKIGDLELCVPTQENPDVNGINIKEFPHMKAVCLTYVGRYDLLPNAYEAMDMYIKNNNLSVKDSWWEVFIKGPGMIIKGNPDKYITEIIFPLDLGDL